MDADCCNEEELKTTTTTTVAEEEEEKPRDPKAWGRRETDGQDSETQQRKSRGREIFSRRLLP
jgi:hypothetical protein